MKNHSRSRNPKREAAYRTPSRLRALRAYQAKVSAKRFLQTKEWKKHHFTMPQIKSARKKVK